MNLSFRRDTLQEWIETYLFYLMPMYIINRKLQIINRNLSAFKNKSSLVHPT